MKKIQLRNANVKSSYNCEKKNNLSSKILASIQIQSQEIIEKFMRKCKSKQKEKAENDKISLERFTLSEKPNKNKLIEIVELLPLEYLNAQEKSVINLISNSSDRFYIPGGRLIATNVLQHQISTND